MNQSYTKATDDDIKRDYAGYRPATPDPLQVRLAVRPDSPKKVFLNQAVPDLATPTASEMFDKAKRLANMQLDELYRRAATHPTQMDTKDVSALNNLIETLSKIAIAEREASKSTGLSALTDAQLEQLWLEQTSKAKAK